MNRSSDPAPLDIDVLLVEDNPSDAALVRAYLAPTAHQRFRITAVVSLAEAVAALGTHAPDCVLLDLSLPDAQELQGLAAVRAVASTIPVIVLTGSDDDLLGEEALRVGAQDFLAKNDVNASILRRSIGHAMTRQRQQLQLERAHAALSHEVRVREAAQETLARTAEELARSNADLSQFAYVAAHDLRAPLGAVSGFVQLLAGAPSVAADPDAVEFVGYIGEGVERMQTLISDLLDYCSIGVGPARRDPVDLGAVAAELPDLFANELAAGAVLDIGDLPVVDGDLTQLRQLFTNLVGNALKFVPFPRRPHVRVRATRGDGFWTVVVADNGIGIAAADRERVFKMFQRLHGDGDFPGTGIGLAIGKRVVEQLGGAIWIESGDPVGARLCFTLPAV